MRLCVAIFFCLLFWQPLLAVEERKASAGVTGERDCSACHPQAANLLASSGTKHINKSGCTFCHKGHPPAETNIIPGCSQCHNGDSSHFNQSNCNGCHTSAHAPLQINYLNNCLDCHTEENSTLKESASKHSRLACTTCHISSPDKPHGSIPNCLSCHIPHGEELTAGDCKKCHHAHSPKNIDYTTSTPSSVCASCHKKAYGLLKASKSKHRDMVCAACHQIKHKIVPQCQTCHSLPHAAKLHARFPKCATCHNTAHDLSDPTAGPAHLN